MRPGRHCSLVVVSVAIAVAALSSCNSSTRSDKKQVAAAENEVYEAVVHDMASPLKGSSQLVFGDALISRLELGEDVKSCQGNALKDLRLETSSPLYDSLADKAYRFASGVYGFVSGRPDFSIREDTIQDFLEKFCTPGRLPQSFHTDLPKAFMDTRSIHFRDAMMYDGAKPFEQLFPGANGIISFSHVGFDSTLHQAIVATSFECGALCAWEDLYVLRKTRGHWEVVKKRMLWES